MTVSPRPRARLRALAVAAVRRADGALLVQRGSDPSRDLEFHRLVGGGIDFGESAAEAVVREFDEELGARLTDVRLLGWLENRFTFAGRPGHEIVAVHVGTLTQRRVLERDDLGVITGTGSTAHWVPADEVLQGPRPLFPDGAVPLLRRWLDDGADEDGTGPGPTGD